MLVREDCTKRGVLHNVKQNCFHMSFGNRDYKETLLVVTMKNPVNLLKPNLTPHKDFSPSQKRLQIPEISSKFIICHRGLLLIYFGNRINQALCCSCIDLSSSSSPFFLSFDFPSRETLQSKVEGNFSFETYERKVGKSSDFAREINFLVRENP